MVLLILGLCLSINAMLFSIVTGTHTYICIACIVSTFCGTIDKSTTWFKARIPNLETLPTWIEPKWLLQSCWHLDCLLCWIHIQKDSLCTCHILWFLMIFYDILSHCWCVAQGGQNVWRGSEVKLFQGVDNTDGMDNCTDWNGLHELTESLASHMSRMRDQKKLQ